MAEAVRETLLRFHREIAVPENERLIDSRIVPFRDQVITNLDGVWKQLETLNQEYQAIKAALRRLEEQIAARSELERLKERVVILEQRLDDLTAKH